MKQIFFSGLFMFFFSALLCAQSADSTNIQLDSLQIQPAADTTSIDSIKPVVLFKQVSDLKNRLLNINSKPVSLAVQFRKTKSKDTIFYLVAGMIMLLGFLKYFYSRYFTNLFRVFFNTSLRQSQLTDQLLQAKLPSLLFNAFFIMSGGIYIYVLLLNHDSISNSNKWIILLSSVGLLGLIYLGKYCTLKFTGWVTGLTEITNTYLFVIFLINKIIGIFLIPFIVILSFSDYDIAKAAVVISLMSIGIFLLLRFFRSYGLLQNQLKISRFHFMLYIAGIELLPLLLIYKGLMIYLTKNL